MDQPTCDALSAISSRTTFIKGAMPNQEKKQIKKAIHAMWNARIGGDEKFARSMRTALPELTPISIGGHPQKLCSLRDYSTPPQSVAAMISCHKHLECLSSCQRLIFSGNRSKGLAYRMSAESKCCL